jgi:hypothetical protein
MYSNTRTIQHAFYESQVLTMIAPNGIQFNIWTDCELGNSNSDLMPEKMVEIRAKIENMRAGHSDKLIFKANQDSDAYIAFSYDGSGGNIEHFTNPFQYNEYRNEGKVTGLAMLVSHELLMEFLDGIVSWFDSLDKNTLSEPVQPSTNAEP